MGAGGGLTWAGALANLFCYGQQRFVAFLFFVLFSYRMHSDQPSPPCHRSIP